MRAVVFVNGDIADYAALPRWLRKDDYLIAADGGARHMEILGLSPAVIVGDLDSIDPALLSRLQKEGADVEQHPAAKDATDLELAIARAVRDGATEILLLGAFGGRLDQTIANLLILAHNNWTVPLTIAEGDQLARVLRGRQSVTLSGPTGGYVSAVALSEGSVWRYLPGSGVPAGKRDSAPWQHPRRQQHSGVVSCTDIDRIWHPPGYPAVSLATSLLQTPANFCLPHPLQEGARCNRTTTIHCTAYSSDEPPLSSCSPANCS